MILFFLPAAWNTVIMAGDPGTILNYEMTLRMKVIH